MINGKRIFLRVPEVGDESIIFNWENHPESPIINYRDSRFTKEEIREWITKSHHDLYLEKQLRLMICDQANQEILGSIDLFDFEPENKSCGIGIIIEKKFRHKNYAYEAIQNVTRFFFEKHMLNKIHCQIHPLNTASIRLFEKSNFKFFKKTETGLYLYFLKNAE